jgi:hypothetical protein
MHKKTVYSYGIWAAMATALWIIAFIIAESIPVFNDLLGITSALFASWFTFGLPSIFWIHMNKRRLFATWKKRLLFLANILNFLVGLIIVSYIFLLSRPLAVQAREGTNVLITVCRRPLCFRQEHVRPRCCCRCWG